MPIQKPDRGEGARLPRSRLIPSSPPEHGCNVQGGDGRRPAPTSSSLSDPGAKHGFSNPAADEAGKKFGLDVAYNPVNKVTDAESWKQLHALLQAGFPEIDSQE